MAELKNSDYLYEYRKMLVKPSKRGCFKCGAHDAEFMRLVPEYANSPFGICRFCAESEGATWLS